MISKRNSLKRMAGAGAVVALAPSSWTKPIIGSIILPAHAQTSAAVLRIRTSGPITGGGNTAQIFANRAENKPVIVSLEVNKPFSVSRNRLTFEPREADSGETQKVDILDSSNRVSATESINVSWVESMLQVVTSGPVVDGENSVDISANRAAGDAVRVDLKVNPPFSLSENQLSFQPLAVGQSESKAVNILNSNGSVNTSESVKVAWVESMLQVVTSGPVVDGENSLNISANSAAEKEVGVSLKVNAPFSLSEDRLAFKPLRAGQSETKDVEILNADRSVNSRESVKVSWVQPKLSIATSGPVVAGRDTNQITGDNSSRQAVIARLSVGAPFSLSAKSLSFSPKEAGQRETQMVDVLNPDRSIAFTESITVEWTSAKVDISTSGPIISGANTDSITANSLERADVLAKLSVKAPFRLSKNSLTFMAMKAGAVDTQVVDVLNQDGSLNSSKSITVTWAEKKK